MGITSTMLRLGVCAALIVALVHAAPDAAGETVYTKYLADQSKTVKSVEKVVGEQEKLVEELQKKHQFAEAKVSALKVSNDMLEKEHAHLVNESTVLTDLVAELQNMKSLLEEEKANFTRMVDEEKTRIEMVRDEMKEQLDKKEASEKMLKACNKSRDDLKALVSQRQPMEPQANVVTKEVSDIHSEARIIQ